MFSNQASRLRRTKWKSASLLAEELHAMFQQDIPLAHDGGVQLRGGEGRSAASLSRVGLPDGPVMDFEGNGTDGNIRVEGGDVIIRGRQLVAEWVDTESGETRQQRFPIEFEAPPPTTSPDTIAVTAPSQIVSGSGQTYTVDFYRNGIDRAAIQVTAVSPGLADTDVLDVDSWHMVSSLPVTQDDGSTLVLYYFVACVCQEVPVDPEEPEYPA